MDFLLKIKGQSAIEYLMTYGWMLLVVAIVGGAVFSMVSGQNIESVQGFNSNEIQITDFGVTEGSGLVFSVSAFLDNTEIQKVSITQENSKEITYNVGQQLSGTQTINFPGLKHAEDTNQADIQVIYNSGGLENLTVEGTVTGSFEVDEDFNNRSIILYGLVGYWPLKQTYSTDTEVLDLSSKNNHVEINGELQEARQSGATYFTNETYLIKSNPELGQMEDSFTVSTWVKLNESGNSTEYPSTVAITSSTGSNSRYAGFKNDNYGERTRCVVNTDEDGFIHASENLPEIDGEYFYTCVWDGPAQEIRLYRDGELVEITETTGQETNLWDQITVGGHPDDGEYFSGELSEATIYDRALSDSKIKTLYNNTRS